MLDLPENKAQQQAKLQHSSTTPTTYSLDITNNSPKCYHIDSSTIDNNIIVITNKVNDAETSSDKISTSGDINSPVVTSANKSYSLGKPLAAQIQNIINTSIKQSKEETDNLLCGTSNTPIETNDLSASADASYKFLDSVDNYRRDNQSDIVIRFSGSNSENLNNNTNTDSDRFADLFHYNTKDEQDDSPTKYQLRALSHKPITFTAATHQHRQRRLEEKLQSLKQQKHQQEQLKKSPTKQLIDNYSDLIDSSSAYPTESDLIEINHLLKSNIGRVKTEEQRLEKSKGSANTFLGLELHTQNLISKLESNPWIQTPALPENLHITNLSHEVISETLNYFVICGERLTQMTKTYDDIDAVVKLLQEKEVDLELAARIGQDLLEQNKQLKSSIQELEDELNKRKEDVQQLKHELASKSSLLQTFIEEEDDENDLSICVVKNFNHQKASVQTGPPDRGSSPSLIIANGKNHSSLKHHSVASDVSFNSDYEFDTDDDYQHHNGDFVGKHSSKSIIKGGSMVTSSPRHKRSSSRRVNNKLELTNQLATTSQTAQQQHDYPDQHQSLQDCCFVAGNSNNDTVYSEKLGKENEILQRTDAILNTVRLTEKDNEEQRLLVQNVTLQLVESNKRLCELQEELAIKSEQNQEQQVKIQRLLTQLRDADTRVNEIGSENDLLQNSIKASLECQKELSDELRDCKRNLSELLSVFVELQHESKRHRLANQNRMPQGLHVLADTTITAPIEGTPLEKNNDHAANDDDDGDGDDFTNIPYLMSKRQAAHDSLYSRSLDLLKASRRDQELPGNSSTSLAYSLKDVGSRIRSSTDYNCRPASLDICHSAVINDDSFIVNDDAETPTMPPSSSSLSSLPFVNHQHHHHNQKHINGEEETLSSNYHHLLSNRYNNNCSPADSLAAEIASTLDSDNNGPDTNTSKSHRQSQSRVIHHDQLHHNQHQHHQQQQHYSIINTDSEDASLGYESENSTTTTNTNNNHHHPQGCINTSNGRRRPRRYQHRQQQQQNQQHNTCCSVASNYNAVSGAETNLNCHHQHQNHCNSCAIAVIGPPHKSTCQLGSTIYDCVPRFLQQHPILLHDNGATCMDPERPCQQQQQPLRAKLCLDSDQCMLHHHHKHQPSQPIESSNHTGKSIDEKDTVNSDTQQQQQVTSNTVSCGVTAAHASAAPGETTKRSMPNSSLLSNKLRLIKMMEGSKHLKQWERLASLDLGSILDNGLDEDQPIDLNATLDSNNKVLGDSFDRRRQNAAATVAALSGLRSQLLSQISLSATSNPTSSSSGRDSGMIDGGEDDHHHHQSSSSAAFSPSFSLRSASTSSASNANQQDMMIDVSGGRSGSGSGLNSMEKSTSSLLSSLSANSKSKLASGSLNGFNLLLSKGGPPANNNSNRGGLCALLDKSNPKPLDTSGRDAIKTKTRGHYSTTDEKGAKNIYDGIVASALSLRTQGGPPLTMEDIKRKLRLTDTSSDSDSDHEQQAATATISTSKTASSLASSASIHNDEQAINEKDKKGSSQTNGHLIDIITVLTAVIIGINENFGDPVLH